MSKLARPVSPNYCATVVRLPDARIRVDGLDKLEFVTIFGFQVLISKGQTGLGVFFPAETQLSDAYCMENNLYRHENLNRYPDQKGYFEDDRRVRAIKFRGNPSNGFFMPLESLAWTGFDISSLVEGDEFDFMGGFEICRKYVAPQKESRARQLEAKRGFVRADKLFMPEHIDTENFFKNADKLDPESEVVVTQKLHGSSIRVGHTMVNRKMSIVEKIASWFKAKIAMTEYAYLYGSRKVIKDANNPDQKHYYDTDIWSTEGKKLDGKLPENYIVYGELIGYASPEKPMQKGYTYGLPKGTSQLYIYRIAIVNPKGYMTDLSWEQVKDFCRKNDLKHVPELFKCKVKNLTDNDFMVTKSMLDVRYNDGVGIGHAVWLGEDQDIVDEGICVRVEGIVPKILKAKSPKFFEHETKILDTNEEDIESSQSNGSN